MDDQPRQDPHRPRFGQSQTYVNAIARSGGAPVLIPLLEDLDLLRAMYDRLDALLLPGGEDIDPAYYGEAVHARCGTISAVRDRVELILIRWAVEDNMPLLAICRGIQVLNVALGGSLYQDIAAQLPTAGRHDWYPGFPRDHAAHQVEIAAGSRLAHLIATPTLPVNSFHHQAIKGLAPGLTVTALAPDGIVEAVEMDGYPFGLGVQWHPEELAPQDAQAQRLFEAFIAASRA